jgi:hypothetical protein
MRLVVEREHNNNFQTDKSRLSCFSLTRKPRQPAFAAEERRYAIWES